MMILYQTSIPAQEKEVMVKQAILNNECLFQLYPDSRCSRHLDQLMYPESNDLFVE